MSRVFALAVLAVALLIAAPAESKPPAPWFCSVDPVVLDDPTGAHGFRVIARDINFGPLWYEPIQLDFSGTSVRLNAVQEPGVTVDCANRTLTKLTGTDGVALFHPRFAGFGAAGTVLVSADGVLLAHPCARSTDLDGLDGRTGIGDFALFAPLLLEGSRSHPEADFDASGGPIGLADFVLFGRALLSGASGSYCP